MEFPGGFGAAPNIRNLFGVGPYSHGYNPFDVKPDSEGRIRSVNTGDDITDSVAVDAWQAFNAKMMAHRAPIVVAGWGYDVFGRPMPNLQKNLAALNGSSSAQDYSVQSNFFDDGRNNPGSPNGFGNAASFPFGGHASSEHYVGGALDVRYDPRHGLWRTNHFVLAEILGHAPRDQSDWSTHVREYEWKEVEAGDAFADDIVRRATNIYCNIAGTDQAPNCAKDPLDYPARSYRVGTDIVNPAINISEMGYNTNSTQAVPGGPRPFLGPPVPSGTVVQLRSVNTIFNDENLNQAYFAGTYIFSFEVPNKIFVEIVESEALNPPYDAVNDGVGQWAGEDEIGCYDNPTTRWYYTGKIKKWVGQPYSQNNKGYYGYFEDDRDFLNFGDGGYCKLINIVEYNNPLALNGRNDWNHVVSPGVNMAPLPGNYPSGFSVRPISTGTIVEATYMPNQWMDDEVYGRVGGAGDGKQSNTPYPLFYFQLANAHDGACATGATDPSQDHGGPMDACQSVGMANYATPRTRKDRFPGFKNIGAASGLSSTHKRAIWD